MTEQTTTPEITTAALDDMRDVLVRDMGIVGAAHAPRDKVVARIAKEFGSMEHFLGHYGH
ncbi:hypothetical protein SD37_11675 [Amycolatopsis orientalis]|uniref:Uncharacterized protein n=1 Tax=Amycolatopsis orientalis TaxID=31958 RepID=A0A193BVI7_AMYOR|nr:hypothetical protein [Amycolatopsis orientalis]ANN16237.1 hypothetical protein SD37_11675 [Amycolatopsis orientalis]